MFIPTIHIGNTIPKINANVDFEELVMQSITKNKTKVLRNIEGASFKIFANLYQENLCFIDVFPFQDRIMYSFNIIH